MRRSGTTRVSWTFTETPAGNFLLVWYEADDVLKIFEILAVVATTRPRRGCAAASRRSAGSS